MFRQSNHSKRRGGRGFTITELMISITIITVITTVVVTNQSTYTDKIGVTNLADQISITLSQAQAYGIGVREFTTGSSNFNIAYGMSFSLLNGVNGSNSDYIYFADRDDDARYDGNWNCATGGANECIEKTAIALGSTITSICIVRSAGGDLCDAGRVDISYARPHIEPRITFFDNPGNPYDPGNVIGAKVNLTSKKGVVKTVAVYTTGQINIQ